jgi:predicted site-specific integrase-resolvase
MVALNRWSTEAGISAITAWRWRKKGWLKTINICGRVYLTADAIAEFTRRAEAGEFAVEHKVPRKGVQQ